MLSLARKYQREMAQKLGYSNVKFVKGKIQDLGLDLELAEEWLNDPITERLKKIREPFVRAREHVAREIAMVRALFGDDEITGAHEAFPNFGELRGQKPAKDLADTDVGEIIAATADPRSPA